MGVQILNKDVSVISRVTNIAKANIGSIFGIGGWAGGGGGTPATQGPLAGTPPGDIDTSVGNISWFGLGFLFSTTSFAETYLFESDVTYYIVGKGFGFSIPVGATINGIIVTLEATVDDGFVREYSVKIVKNDLIVGDEKSTGASLSVGSFGNKTYGSSTDLWGETWTAADINSNKFGFAYSVECASFTKVGVYPLIRNLRITVNYTT